MLSIEDMEIELRRAGWEQKTSYIWRAPNGALFLGPTGAWRTMRRVTTPLDLHDRQTGRDRMLARGMRLRLEIEQIFIDCAAWNDNSEARQEGAEPIDPDPDGQMRRIADGLDKHHAQESQRKAAACVPQT